MMGGVVDAIKDIGQDIIDTAVNAVETTFNVTSELIQGNFKEAYEELEGGVKEGFDILKDMAHHTVNLLYEVTGETLDIVDEIFSAVGIEGSMKFLQNLNEGANYLAHGILNGDWDAIKAGALIAIMVVITWFTAGATADRASMFIVNILGEYLITNAVALQVIYYSTIIAQIAFATYGALLPIAEIGKAVVRGNVAPIFKVASDMRAAMNLSLVTSAINNTKDRWMAGGDLYDAPRAGDVLFNPTGVQNTTKFLGLQDQNINSYITNNVLGYGHEPHRKVYGSFAGEVNFSVNSLVK